MAHRPRIRYSAEQKADIWNRWHRGESMCSIGRLFESIIGGTKPGKTCLVADTVLTEIGFDTIFGTSLAMIADIGEKCTVKKLLEVLGIDADNSDNVRLTVKIAKTN